MKKTVLTAVALCILGYSVHAQKNPNTAKQNALINYADYEMNKTESSLTKAQTNIDFASAHEKTKNDPKVLRSKGQIYVAIANNENLKKENGDAALKAFQAYMGALQEEIKVVEAKGKPATKIKAKNDFKKGFENTARALFNQGLDAYNAKDYALAYNSFNSILKIKEATKEALAKKPVSLMVGETNLEQDGQKMAGIAAVKLGQFTEAENLLTPLMEGGKLSKESVLSLYKDLSNGYLKANKMAKAKEVLAKARKEYPTDQGLLLTEINIALSEGKLAQLESKLQEAVENDPNNIDILFVMGNMYDELFRGKLEAGEDQLAKDFFAKSVKWYKQALSVNNQHFNSAYSLGAIHVNFSNYYANKMNNMENAASPEYKATQEEYKRLLNEGLTHLLSAEKIQPDNLGTAVALKEVYSRLEDEANWMKYKKRVDELKK